MKSSDEVAFIRNTINALMDGAEEHGFNEVLSFALSNKLLSACVSSGLLGERDGFDVLAGQRRIRAKAMETIADACNEFSAHGIRYAVIKGLAFEKAIYGDSPMRDVGDVDILINADDIPCAHKRLCQMGYEQQLGPSSGSMASLGRARFAARVSRQKYFVSETPMRRFPYKDAYCPYVKPGYPAVELHDGFRGLPGWYTDDVIDRACRNRLSLMEDRLDIMIFLLANSYENAESFYSNCFDDKITLRDFVDLACYLRGTGNSIDWKEANALITELGIAEEAGRILYDLDDLLPGEASWALPNIPRLKSLWNVSIRERVGNADLRRRSVLQVIRNDAKSLAMRAKVGLSDAPEGNAPPAPSTLKPVVFSLLKSDGGAVLYVSGVGARRDGSCLVEISIFPIEGENRPLCSKISVLLEEGSPVAYCRDFDRIPDGFATWTQAGMELSASYRGEGEVAITIPYAMANRLLREGETAISAGIYDRKFGNVFWARCRGKATLTGDVPIGHLSLYCGPGIATATVEASFVRHAIASNDGHLLASVCAVHDRTAVGAPVDCDVKPVRNYAIMRETTGTYALEISGRSFGRNLSIEKASSKLIQDITDWTATELLKGSVLAHASSNLVDDGAVLCMGPSGSGKTSLSLALARYWPLRGDECSCIDFDNGTTWTEPLPVNVKAGNEFALGLASGKPLLTCESEIHGITFCINRHIVECDSRPSKRVKIKAIVFPTYDGKAPYTEIANVAYDKFIPLVLGSLLGEERPSILLSRFMRIVSVFDIKLLSVRYSDAATAAGKIFEYMQKRERTRDVQAG